MNVEIGSFDIEITNEKKQYKVSNNADLLAKTSNLDEAIVVFNSALKQNSVKLSEKNRLSFNKLFNNMPFNCSLTIRLGAYYEKLDIFFKFEDRLSPKVYVGNDDMYIGQCTEDNLPSYEYDNKYCHYYKDLENIDLDNNLNKYVQNGLNNVYSQVIKKLKKLIKEAKYRVAEETKNIEEAELFL